MVAASSADPVPFYVIQKSVNGEPEFLFEIAQRFLGDGNRFNEIFELNKGRQQPDGGVLTDPTSLVPGWVLQMPTDAKGDGIQVGPLPGAVQSPPGATSTQSPTHAPARRASTSPPPTHVANGARAVSDTQGAAPLLWIVIAIVVLAALAAAGYVILRRRRSAAPTAEANHAIADRSASWTIDSALKILVDAYEAEQIRFPGLYLVTVDSSSIHVLLSAPSASVPSGWSASSDGRTWTAPLGYLQGQRVPEVSSEQFSGLVTLGTTQEGRVLLDFHQATGVISVEGTSIAVTDVVEGWLSELESNPWSGSPHVARIGARGNATRETLDDFLARIDGAESGIAVLDAAPTRSQGEAIRALYAAPDFRWIIIVKGAYAGASWSFKARDGVLVTGILPDVRYPAGSNRKSPIVTS
jgi:hypothetical protein